MNEKDISILLKSIDKPVQEMKRHLKKLQDLDNHYLWFAPMEEDVERKNDEWESHCFESLGFSIETQCHRISLLSLFLRFQKGYTPYSYEKPYYGFVPFGLGLKMKKEDVCKVLGKPMKACENMQQYHLDDKLILGLIYDDYNGFLRVVSVGSMRIFSDEDVFPSRFSEVYDSLYNL